jgi:hypothetical protein
VGSTVTLQFFAHVEDRTRLGEPDYYAIGVFSGTTLIYNTGGQIVDGDLSVGTTCHAERSQG